MMRRGHWSIIVWFALLTACSSLPTGPASESETARAAQQVYQPTTAQPFERQGRFAVHAQGHDQSTDAVQGAFHWYDNGEQLVLELRNPLGQMMGKLQVNDRGAWLQDNRAGMRYASSADELAQEIFGQPIPVQGLRAWLRGASSADAREQQYEGGHLAQARDQGWRLTLSDYDARGPKRLFLVFQQGAQRVSVRIVIDAGTT